MLCKKCSCYLYPKNPTFQNKCLNHNSKDIKSQQVRKNLFPIRMPYNPLQYESKLVLPQKYLQENYKFKLSSSQDP